MVPVVAPLKYKMMYSFKRSSVQGFLIGFFVSYVLTVSIIRSAKLLYDTPTTPTAVTKSGWDNKNKNKNNTSVWNSTQQEGGLLAFVTFVHLLDESRFERFVFPALDTWLSLEETNHTPMVYHVVMSTVWEKKYHSELCPKYPTYCERIKPVFVPCPEGAFGKSPCCKQERALLLLQQTTQYQFYVYHDDDCYFRTAQLMEFLRNLQNETMNTNDPYVITGGVLSKRLPLGQTSYLPRDRRKYHCASNNEEFTYNWGQPVLYPRHTLAYLTTGLAGRGLTKQCEEYRLTHDVGNALFHWMYSLPELRIRFSAFPSRRDGRSFGTHGVDRFLGKGPDARPTLNMTELQALYRTLSFIEPQKRIWYNVTGFHQTPTYQLRGDPSTWGNHWHTMPTTECRGPKT